MIHYNATIHFYVEDCHWYKVYSGTKKELEAEAEDFINVLICRYLRDNDIKDAEEQDDIIAEAHYDIVYDEELFTTMFAVLDDGGVQAIYATRADAEEAIFNECEDEVYELLMACDPEDVFGVDEFDFKKDFWYLMKDCADTFTIEEVSVYEP